MPPAEHDINTIDEKTETARKLLFELENSLRSFVNSKLKDNEQRIPRSFWKDWANTRKKERIPPREPLEYDPIYYSTFDQLKKIIVQNENWSQLFQEHFGRPDGIISRINELDSIRDTIAHNRILSDPDYRSFVTLYEQIMRCLSLGEERKDVKELTIDSQSINLQDSSSFESQIDLEQYVNFDSYGINNKLLTEVYEQSRRISAKNYYDVKLRDFSIQITPWFGNTACIVMEFYSKFAKRTSVFYFYTKAKRLEHQLPDEYEKYAFRSKVYRVLPWKKNPNWIEFMKKYYAKVGPITPSERSWIVLSAPLFLREEGFRWWLTIRDGLTGRQEIFEWNGKEINDQNVKSL
jgi:hypothetical protein